jgi:bifunctional non-homologous end joining protein LigD
VKRDDTSALSGRSMKAIGEAADATWHSNRSSPTLPNVSDLPEAEMAFVEPMLAQPAKKLPDSRSWQYELKLDGYRTIAVKGTKEVQLFSRRGNRTNRRFPAIAESLSNLPPQTIVDGEVVALDDNGKPSFGMLQNFGTVPADALRFYLFDVLAWRGKDVRTLRLEDRRVLLNDIMLNLESPVLMSEIFDARIEDLIRATKKAGLEGIVAKRTDSKYQSGERSGAWVKYKTNQSHEFVIGGYKPGTYEFEYLLAGYYAGSKLLFIAKIKNGFVPQLRRDVARAFKGLESDRCPFANLPEPGNARRGEAITREVMPKLRWLTPKLVAQVEFTEWTSNDHLRHAKFVALRDDKAPTEVIRESA